MVTVFTLEVAVIQKRAIKKPVKLLLVAFLFISSLTGHFGLQFFFLARVHSLFETLCFILFLFSKAILYLAGTT